MLDIGTANGIIGKHFHGSGLLISGLEILSEAAKIANPYYSEFYCGSINQVDDDFIAGKDIIICADILEHTSNPWQILERLVKLQKPNFQIFISVPNIANIWVRTSLLFGKFEYTNKGILDCTHLRFFTKKTLLEMINGSGLKVLQIRYTPLPLPQVNSFFYETKFGRFFHKVLNRLTQVMPSLLAYQFIVRATIDKGIKPK